MYLEVLDLGGSGRYGGSVGGRGLILETYCFLVGLFWVHSVVTPIFLCQIPVLARHCRDCLRGKEAGSTRTDGCIKMTPTAE